jgi:hypothetical protein
MFHKMKISISLIKSNLSENPQSELIKQLKQIKHKV